MKSVEPEISLAVRLPPPEFIADEDKEEEEEKAEEASSVDEYLSTNGFEFVDVSSPTEHEVQPDSALCYPTCCLPILILHSYPIPPSSIGRT